MRQPHPTGLVLAVALGILLASSVYGVLASETGERTNRWTSGPRQIVVQSGNCNRSWRWLPSLEPQPPDFIRYGITTYLRVGPEVETPPKVRDTRFRYRTWKLLRAGDRLYVETIGREGKALMYARGECAG